MRDEEKTREQLIRELGLLRQENEKRLADIETLKQAVSSSTHQISNAITTLSGRAQLCQMGTVSGDKLAEVCEQQTTRILTLLKTLSRIAKEMEV